ncbi:Ku protein [Streptomyces brasiliensis]|uniref:Ku domain-containing protein n=1 Tax=Streptomyces brasiliensis TaxID=1954 RepID=A0A917PEW5_9ACTN|nr:Ku protein [Streptomyces brasiliensis]GGJ73533.1 hypothetical protein GCM10010121_100100 [Streptomyces brasiliensis]
MVARGVSAPGSASLGDQPGGGLDVLGFVESDTVEPVSYQRAYYARPASLAAERPYEVLVAALARTGLVGIARTALRSRERLAVLYPWHGVLVVHTAFWPDEIREPGPAATGPVTERELELAEVLLGQLQGIDAQAVHDDYAKALHQLVAALSSGRTPAAPAVPREPPLDLMAALEASIRAARLDQSS